MSRWTQQFTNAEALAKLSAHGVPAAPVRHPSHAVRDPIVLERREWVPLEHPVHGPTSEVYGSGVPIMFSGARAGFDRPRPELGEHNRAVYGELLGYDAALVDELRALGVS